jgi:hypothetical protein
LPQKPEDASNRRISLIVQYQVKDNAEVAPQFAVAATKVTGGQR